MAIKAGESDESGLEKKPRSMWMADDGLSIICPFCEIEKQSDADLGHHLVHDHWRGIEDATERKRERGRDLNYREN